MGPALKGLDDHFGNFEADWSLNCFTFADGFVNLAKIVDDIILLEIVCVENYNLICTILYNHLEHNLHS